jgi:hypothetical protein
MPVHQNGSLMNTLIHLQYTSECQAKNLTNTAQKYIKESIFKISLADFEIMFLSNTFGSRAAGALMLGAASLASFGSTALAQQGQLANAPAGQPAVTQPAGKSVILRIGKLVHPNDARDLKRSIIESGCTLIESDAPTLPRDMSIQVGNKKHSSRTSAGAATMAEIWCHENEPS